ncbi:MAG TPA: AsmA family protein, partial [Thermodesulfovibrionales bacterium]|nr:AsmA family protein [Thermodesulfovibrionales bacterium]
NVNVYKPRIEAAASDAIGMDFKIGGTMKIVLFPRFGVSLENVLIKKRELDLLSAQRVRIGLKLLPLIKREARISEFTIIKPKITIERDKNGRFNFEGKIQKPAKEEKLPVALLTMGSFVISKGELVFLDRISNTKTELNSIDLNIKNLSFTADRSNRFLQDISFSGNFQCNALKTKGFEVKNIKLDMKGKNGIFDISPIAMDSFGKAERGSIRVDITGEKPLFRAQYTASKFYFERFWEAVSKKQIAKGDTTTPGKKSGNETELTNVDLTIASLSFGKGGKDLFNNIFFSGDFQCKSLKTKDFEVKNIKLDMKGKNGIFDISPITMNFFGGTEKGDIKADLRGDSPFLKIQFAATKFNFEKFVEAFSRKKIMEGQMDFSLNIMTKRKSLEEMKKSMNGEAFLKGENLLLYSLDLDSLLSKIEQSQSFSLVDVGAFFLAGPLGTVLTKGYDFAGVYQETRGGQGIVKKLVSEWRIKNGIAEAEDVALSTKINRIAMKGGLDFVNSQFDDVTVAALDENGCAKFSQKIHGPFRNPQIDKISTLKTIVGPAVKLFEKAQKFILGCKVFYKGSIKHPV